MDEKNYFTFTFSRDELAFMNLFFQNGIKKLSNDCFKEQIEKIFKRWSLEVLRREIQSENVIDPNKPF